MKTTTRPRRTGLFALSLSFALVGVAACGSDGPPSTATPGSKFCTLAEEAREIGDEIDPNSGDADRLEQQVDAALDASRKAADAAPKDFQDLAEETVESQEQLADLLAEYDWQWVAAFTSDEGQELFDDPRQAELQAEREDYLADNCDLEPTDDTIGGDLQFSPGDDGIRELIGLLRAGTDTEITDDQIECMVDALSGTLSDDDVAAIANQGEVSEAGAIAFSVAIGDCGIDIAGS